MSKTTVENVVFAHNIVACASTKPVFHITVGLPSHDPPSTSSKWPSGDQNNALHFCQKFDTNSQRPQLFRLFVAWGPGGIEVVITEALKSRLVTTTSLAQSHESLLVDHVCPVKYPVVFFVVASDIWTIIVADCPLFAAEVVPSFTEFFLIIVLSLKTTSTSPSQFPAIPPADSQKGGSCAIPLNNSDARDHVAIREKCTCTKMLGRPKTSESTPNKPTGCKEKCQSPNERFRLGWNQSCLFEKLWRWHFIHVQWNVLHSEWTQLKPEMVVVLPHHSFSRWVKIIL